VIEDATAKNNDLFGFVLAGTGISVENAYIKNNGRIGLSIASNVENNEITLSGDITVTNNKYGFGAPSSAQGTVYVTGDFDLNRNGLGLGTFSQDLTIAVGGSYSGKSGKSGSGSITACDNPLYDIVNFGPSTFEGSDYTCDTTSGTDLPVCKPCHPGCPSASMTSTRTRSLSEPDESSFQIMSAAFEINELDFADHMDHGEIPV
jgi:hypothetical protein